jgi:hypothetical protein
VSDPDVDVVVAVHSSQRPVERAVSSALADSVAAVRVTVVCHNIDSATIESRLTHFALDERVRLLELHDGIPSPAGPFNHGLDAATAPFTAVLGSDDELERGAIDSWLALQRKHGADIVIPRLRFASGASLRSPQTRPFRSRNLNAVKDRLAYRTAQLGLVSRARYPALRFTTGLRTGEDIEYGLRLWFSDARISFDRQGPAYLIHAESNDRATISSKDVADDFAFLSAALNPQWTDSLNSDQREAIAVKLLRTHLVDALSARFLAGTVPRAEQLELAAVARRIFDFAPTAAGIVSRRDARILRTLLAGDADEAQFHADLAVRADFRRPTNVLSASPSKMLHREAPLRFLGALLLTP